MRLYHVHLFFPLASADTRDQYDSMVENIAMMGPNTTTETRSKNEENQDSNDAQLRQVLIQERVRRRTIWTNIMNPFHIMTRKERATTS